ncbi:hypothetical protein KIPB_011657 [Kipferlia bialata]|uniref:Uncharacterized protein n=1 Tax=Kipferlia bialata TaxID=797122 RepID=A0A9K3D5X3_9EUKA|nr:hypothetical protein KIPB_011657 [Kipferlia bialata]|eukprot:g11657.t1
MWLLLVCCMLPDLQIGINFCFTGLNNYDYYWISHGLFMCTIWALLTGIITGVIYSGPAGVVCCLLVLSHWGLDFICLPWDNLPIDKIPRLPIMFDLKPNAGLGMYETLTGAIVGEALGLVAMVIGLVLVY